MDCLTRCESCYFTDYTKNPDTHDLMDLYFIKGIVNKKLGYQNVSEYWFDRGIELSKIIYEIRSD